MRRTKVGNQNITLSVRVPKDEAVRIIGRLWAKGIISDKQYIRRLDELDNEKAVLFAKKRLETINILNKGGTK